MKIFYRKFEEWKSSIYSCQINNIFLCAKEILATYTTTKKNSLFCLLLTSPIDTACRLWWSILIKFAIETRERKKFSLIFSISLFNNFHVLLLLPYHESLKISAGFAGVINFLFLCLRFTLCFSSFIFLSSQGKMEISFLLSFFFVFIMKY